MIKLIMEQKVCLSNAWLMVMHRELLTLTNEVTVSLCDLLTLMDHQLMIIN